PPGPAAADPVDLASRPSGVRDLYTWQSRRLLLHHDADGVHGVVLAYGDPLAPQEDMHRSEPLTGWRRSPAREKKLGRPLVYMPREHDPARAAWRGLSSLLAHQAPGAAQRKGAASAIRPRVLDWVAQLITEGALPGDRLIRARLFGAVYGTQQSVIDDMVDDGVTMAVILLHEEDRRFGQAAIDAVADAEAAVLTLGDLATALAEAAGADPEPRRATARDRGFGALDGPFRHWLRELRPGCDPHRQRAEWQRLAHRIVSGLGNELLAATGDAAWEGRFVETKGGPRWLTASSADLRFRIRLNEALHHPFAEAGGASPPTEAPRHETPETHP
ncbi:type I-E CRISPR-associated protein Cse1/CasA, partial [Streptomyces syringium]|uniref:type I-E CRISPR-associated protein Cse1/CasA n=1 Tax=Streptomyces syringium TaxID=76729 RepID=UPI0033F9A5BD